MRKPKNPHGKRGGNPQRKNETRLSTTCANSRATRNNVFLKVFFQLFFYMYVSFAIERKERNVKRALRTAHANAIPKCICDLHARV